LRANDYFDYFDYFSIDVFNKDSAGAQQKSFDFCNLMATRDRYRIEFLAISN